MKRVVAALTRHGAYQQPASVPSAHLPHPLTSSGETQAREGAALLLDEARRAGWSFFPVIETSRMLRGWQTGIIISEELGRELGITFRVEEHDALAERGLGSAANLTLEQIERVLEADPRADPPPAGWRAHSFYKLPLQGAESLMEAGERAARFISGSLEALRRETDRDTVTVFVGHGGAFRHAAVHLGVLKVEDAPRLSMYHCQPVFLELLADGTWSHVGGRWKTRSKTEPAD